MDQPLTHIFLWLQLAVPTKAHHPPPNTHTPPPWTVPFSAHCPSTAPQHILIHLHHPSLSVSPLLLLSPPFLYPSPHNVRSLRYPLHPGYRPPGSGESNIDAPLAVTAFLRTSLTPQGCSWLRLGHLGLRWQEGLDRKYSLLLAIPLRTRTNLQGNYTVTLIPGDGTSCGAKEDLTARLTLQVSAPRSPSRSRTSTLPPRWVSTATFSS